MANKYAAKGVTFAYGSPLVTVASVKSVSGPKLSTEQIDVTTHDSESGYREFVSSFKDSGEVTLNLVFDPADTSQTGLKSLYDSGATTPFKITWPTTPATNLAFSGNVSSFEWAGMEVSNALEASISIKVSGPVTLG